MQINKMIDHTLLKPTATKAEILNLISEAKTYQFYSVCINSSHLLLAKEQLKGSDIKICCVAGFPLGACNLETKIAEIDYLVKNGCDEIDFVINIAALKEGDFTTLEKEFLAIRQAGKGHVIKTIIETCFLTKEEITAVCKLADKCGLDFVKTSTGFASGGATVADVALMKSSVSSKTQVKASGGVRSYEDAMQMINAGATRLGTSNGIAIIKNIDAKNNY